jgi:hypothetical protein
VARASLAAHVTSALICAVGVLWPRATSAQTVTKEQCIAAYTDAQHHRKGGELLRARTELRVCASDPCSALLQNDCSQWLSEIDRMVPSVVFAARDAAGADVLNVSVAIDGNVVAPRLDGRPVDVDPGEHLLRFEAPDRETVEQRVLFSEGEKARLLSVTMTSVARKSTAPTPPDTLHQTRPIPTTTWILGGIGVAGLGAAATMALVGLPTWNRCHDGGCSVSDKRFSDSLNTVGDIATVVGAVSVLAAAYFFLTRPSVSPARF